MINYWLVRTPTRAEGLLVGGDHQPGRKVYWLVETLIRAKGFLVDEDTNQGGFTSIPLVFVPMIFLLFLAST
ncbi:Uncharacterised protein [Sphingobacterium daejeonense]|nr:Uncharacterised protein [Sphingobacterium daejeonense]